MFGCLSNMCEALPEFSSQPGEKKNQDWMIWPVIYSSFPSEEKIHRDSYLVGERACL